MGRGRPASDYILCVKLAELGRAGSRGRAPSIVAGGKSCYWVFEPTPTVSCTIVVSLSPAHRPSYPV